MSIVDADPTNRQETGAPSWPQLRRERRWRTAPARAPARPCLGQRRCAATGRRQPRSRRPARTCKKIGPDRRASSPSTSFFAHVADGGRQPADGGDAPGRQGVHPAADHQEKFAAGLERVAGSPRHGQTRARSSTSSPPSAAAARPPSPATSPLPWPSTARRCCWTWT